MGGLDTYGNPDVQNHVFFNMSDELRYCIYPIINTHSLVSVPYHFSHLNLHVLHNFLKNYWLLILAMHVLCHDIFSTYGNYIQHVTYSLMFSVPVIIYEFIKYEKRHILHIKLMYRPLKWSHLAHVNSHCYHKRSKQMLIHNWVQ